MVWLIQTYSFSTLNSVNKKKEPHVLLLRGVKINLITFKKVRICSGVNVCLSTYFLHVQSDESPLNSAGTSSYQGLSRHVATL